MKFLGELKRRNVFRIGMAYIVAAWVLIQLGYVIAQNYGAPDWVMGVFITFLICALPIVLYFTWVFALTTDGIRKESDLQRVDSLTRKTGHKLDYITMALLAVIVGMARPPVVFIHTIRGRQYRRNWEHPRGRMERCIDL